MTQILLLGGTLYHNIEQLAPIFTKFLTKEGYSVTITKDMNQLKTKNLQKFDVVIDYTTEQEISASQAQSLLTAVKINSKFYLGIHGATTSYKVTKKMLKMIGARFLKHPPIRKINVVVEAPNHPIMKGIFDFTIRDELYLQDYYPPFQTLLSTQYKRETIPLSWIKPYGNGLVFYLALGHGKEQLCHKSVQQIIKNVLAYWLSRR